MLLTAHEQQRCPRVDDDGERRDPQDDVGGDWLRRKEAVQRLKENRSRGHEQQRCVAESGENGCAPIAVGARRCWPPCGEPRPGPCQQQSDHIGEVVYGIRNQRQGVRKKAEAKLSDDEHDIEGRADRER